MLEDWEDIGLKSETVFENNVSFLSVIPETNSLILVNHNADCHLVNLKLGESDESSEKINDYFLVTPDNYDEINFINMKNKITLFKCSEKILQTMIISKHECSIYLVNDLDCCFIQLKEPIITMKSDMTEAYISPDKNYLIY